MDNQTKDDLEYSMSKEELTRTAANLDAWARSPAAMQKFLSALEGTAAEGIDTKILSSGLKLSASWCQFVADNFDDFSANKGYFTAVEES